jgi:glycerol-3-phosphate dehydrogenase
MMDLHPSPQHPACLEASQRPSVISSLPTQTFDLLVIGGGVTGAGIALDAASRGLKTLLVEKADFASGTSSKSTKLIHGGLRYLKNMEINLVREVGQERAIVYRNAPHLVRPDKMLLPVVRGGSYGLTALGTALWTYDRLAGVLPEERRTMLSTEEALYAEPLLGTHDLQGAGLYTEYQTDDARLTLAIVRKAAQLGAICLNYLEVVDFNYHGDGVRICGATLRDLPSGLNVQVKAHVVVNAAGPWVDGLRSQQEALGATRIVLSKGIHIVVKAADFPLRNATYFDVGDGRMVFAIPVREVVYIGTTDTHHAGSPDELKILPTEVAYLLGAVNRMFPTVQLAPRHIVSGWVGVRPLIAQPGKSTTEISRKDEIFISEAGLVTIAGGKLTGYRKMAERVTDKVADILLDQKVFQSVPRSHTAEIPLSGGDLPDPLSQMPAMMRQIATAHQLPDKEAWWLVKRFGSDAPAVAALLPAGDAPADQRVAMAALEFGLRQEGILCPDDFFVRRTGFLYFEPWRIEALIEPVLARMAEVLKWDANLRRNMRARISRLVEEVRELASFAK